VQLTMIKNQYLKAVTASWRCGRRSVTAAMLITLATLASCGGESSNPLGNAPTVNNPTQTGGTYLSFAYYQKCINPIFLAQIQTQLGNVTSTSTCAGSGCHETTTGAGGAFRLVSGAQPIDLSNAANTPAVIRASDMYKNFYSAQAAVLIGSPTQSRLVNKPMVRGVLHGGGLIFLDDTDPNVQLFNYWISHPAPQGQDEFSTATYSMFTPPDPQIGACNI
jgi:hypothetical protein